MLKSNVKDNFQGKGRRLTVRGQGQGQLGLAVQGKDQDPGLETQDHVLEDSISDVHKTILRTGHCIQYRTPPHP